MAKSKSNKKRVQKSNSESIYKECIQYATQSLKNGESEQSIASSIKEAYPIMTEQNIDFAILKASQNIGNEFKRDSKSIVALHVKRYDKEIKRLLDKTYDELIEEDEEGEGAMSQVKKRQRRIYALMTCLDVLTAKERVLQLHTKETQVRIYNKINAKVNVKKAIYDLSGLNFEQKVQFLSLINKAKKTDNELFSIKQNNSSHTSKIEDAEFEIVDNSKSMFNKIKVQNEHSLKDNKERKVKEVKNLNSITDKIQQKLIEKAKVELMIKGVKNSSDKIIDRT